MTSWWERHVVPRMVDLACGTGEVHKLRTEVCRGLRGRVLEIGFGSGLNVTHYPPEVSEVAGVEPSGLAWHLAEPRVAAASIPVARTGLDGQRLEEPDGSFDSVLCTFVLCTIPDHLAALREAHRVLRPGGELHFVEHGRSPDPGVARWQRRIEPVQRRVAGGCHLTRHPVEALTLTGFEVGPVREEYLKGPAVTRPFGYVYVGTATKAA